MSAIGDKMVKAKSKGKEMLQGIKKKVLQQSQAKRKAEKFISSQDYFG